VWAGLHRLYLAPFVAAVGRQSGLFAAGPSAPPR